MDEGAAYEWLLAIVSSEVPHWVGKPVEVVRAQIVAMLVISSKDAMALEAVERSYRYLWSRKGAGMVVSMTREPGKLDVPGYAMSMLREVWARFTGRLSVQAVLLPIFVWVVQGSAADEAARDVAWREVEDCWRAMRWPPGVLAS